MKKITSILLLVSLLISILYIPGVMMNVAADEPVKHTLPDGTIMESGKYVLPEKDRLGDDGVTGYIKTAADFRAMKPGGRYSLANDIDLTLSGEDITGLTNTHIPLFKDDNSDEGGIRFDGGGYTIKTDNMLFYRIPKDSTFVNFVIDGNINIQASYVDGTHWAEIPNNGPYAYPYYSLASLCGHAHGGTFKNIINKAGVMAQGSNESANYAIRVSGLIGSAYNESVLIQNCHNMGRIWSQVHGENMAVAGILAYTQVQGDIPGKSTQRTYLMGCRNDGQIKNTATSTAAKVYAGGILGVKHDISQVQIIDCSTVKATDTIAGGTDKMIIAKDSAGAGCDGCTAKATLSNLTYDPNAIPVRSAEDFANMSGNNNYYLLESFRVVEQNKNVFTGTIYGATRRIDSDIPHFAHHINESQCNSLALKVEGGYKKITTAYEFYTVIQNPDLENNKFYLGADIDLTEYPDWTGPKYWKDNREKAKNGEIPIILDGCGYTITTNKPIFVELPGGGDPKNEIHSIMRNIVIDGNVTVSQDDLASYNGSSYENGNSIGALVGKTNGGIFDNIINYASVTFNGNTSARVGGIVGSTFNDDLFMINCENNGTVTATVHGERCGVGGIIGLVGYNGDSTDAGVTANLNNCVNTANVKNDSNNDFHVYAGGVVGVKFQNQTVVCLRDCDSTGTVRAKTAYGKYCADRLQQNFHIIRTK